jgi:Cu-processing system permease protein
MSTRLAAVRTIASWEMRGAARSRWLLGAAVLYGGAAVALTLVGLRSLRELGLGGAGSAIDGLVALGVLLPPLIGLLLGASSIAGPREHGTLSLIASQPIPRATVPWGTVVGLTATVWAALAAGLGLVAVVLAPVATAADAVGVAVAAGAGLAAAAVGVSLGVLVSTLSTTRSQATAVAAAVWFVAALGIDLLLATVAPGIRLGPTAMLWAIVLNPLESIRILALVALDHGALGPFGVYLFDRFGTAGAAAILGSAVTAWIVVPALLAGVVLKRRDV